MTHRERSCIDENCALVSFIDRHRISFHILVKLFCIFLCALMFDVSSAQQERGIRIADRDPQRGVEMGIYNDLWAVVVGIDKYESWKQLRYAVKDAEAIAGLLTSMYGFRKDHIVLLKDGEATLQGIKTALGSMIQKASEDDGVVFFFAGHG